MAKCNALIPTSFATPGMSRLLFAQNVVATNSHQTIMRTAKDLMAQFGIGHTAKHAESRVVEKIGRVLFTTYFLPQACSSAKFAKLKSNSMSFTPTAVLPMAQKNTALGVNRAFLCLQNKVSQLYMQVRQKSVQHPQKTLYPAHLIMRPKESNTLGLTLIWSICCKSMNNRMGVAP